MCEHQAKQYMSCLTTIRLWGGDRDFGKDGWYSRLSLGSNPTFSRTVQTPSTCNGTAAEGGEIRPNSCALLINAKHSREVMSAFDGSMWMAAEPCLSTWTCNQPVPASPTCLDQVHLYPGALRVFQREPCCIVANGPHPFCNTMPVTTEQCTAT